MRKKHLWIAALVAVLAALVVMSCGIGPSAPSSAKAITAFSFTSPAATGTVDENEKTIAVTVPYGTDVTTLVGTYTTTGVSVKVGTTVQISGQTANNFKNPVSYIVSAANGSTSVYTVTVTIASISAKDITEFSFTSPAAPGTIDQDTKTISVTLPYGTNVKALVATFVTTGQSVMVGATIQKNGTTPNDFTLPVEYMVTAADNSMVTYTVIVNVALNSAKAITSFSILGIAGMIDESAKTIWVNMPYGTDVRALVATFTTTAVSVSAHGVSQVSGITANDFTSPVSYVVTAADTLTVTYTVTVNVALISAKAITSFSVLGSELPINESAKTISVKVPYGTDVTALVATFTTTGARVSVRGVTQVSGVTANDFRSPVPYMVTAEDNSVVTYTVTGGCRGRILETHHPPVCYPIWRRV